MCKVRGETEKAYRIFDGTKTEWVPKSQVEMSEDYMKLCIRCRRREVNKRSKHCTECQNEEHRETRFLSRRNKQRRIARLGLKRWR